MDQLTQETGYVYSVEIHDCKGLKSHTEVKPRKATSVITDAYRSLGEGETLQVKEIYHDLCGDVVEEFTVLEFNVNYSKMEKDFNSVETIPHFSLS